MASSQFRRVPNMANAGPAPPPAISPKRCSGRQAADQVISKDALAGEEFYIDYAGGKIYLVDDPTNHKVEATVASSLSKARRPTYR